MNSARIATGVITLHSSISEKLYIYICTSPCLSLLNGRTLSRVVTLIIINYRKKNHFLGCHELDILKRIFYHEYFSL